MVDAMQQPKQLGFAVVGDSCDNIQWIVYCEKMCVMKICREKNDPWLGMLLSKLVL